MHDPGISSSSAPCAFSCFLITAKCYNLRTELEKQNCFLCGRLFDDVIPALKELAEQGTRVYVFSSRCSDSQRLLFAYSKDGDQSEVKFKYGCQVGLCLFPVCVRFCLLCICANPPVSLFSVHIWLLWCIDWSKNGQGYLREDRQRSRDDAIWCAVPDPPVNW